MHPYSNYYTELNKKINFDSTFESYEVINIASTLYMVPLYNSSEPNDSTHVGSCVWSTGSC